MQLDFVDEFLNKLDNRTGVGRIKEWRQKYSTTKINETDKHFAFSIYAKDGEVYFSYDRIFMKDIYRDTLPSIERNLKHITPFKPVVVDSTHGKKKRGEQVMKTWKFVPCDTIKKQNRKNRKRKPDGDSEDKYTDTKNEQTIERKSLKSPKEDSIEQEDPIDSIGVIVWSQMKCCDDLFPYLTADKEIKRSNSGIFLIKSWDAMEI